MVMSELVLGRSAPYSTEAGDVAMSSVIASPIPARYAEKLGIARAVRVQLFVFS